MIFVSIILVLICIGESIYIFRIRKQLTEWLLFLKSLHLAPKQYSFIKGKDILADINFELNRILEESRKQFIKLQRAEHANQQLLTDLSHDVRTPLASLIGYLEALDSQNTKEQKEYIHISYKKALDLQELIDMLFQWFKFVSKEQIYHKKIYDINELTREIIIESIPILEKKQISFAADIPDEEWFVKIDRTAYTRIINNLLNNAVKHGNGSLIEIEIRKLENKVLLSVSNNGTAIPKKDLPFIFNRLYKCEPARSESGNGLGLAIVKELTNAMSGEITVQSIQGGKTTFYLKFPLLVRKN